MCLSRSSLVPGPLGDSEGRYWILGVSDRGDAEACKGLSLNRTLGS